VNSALRPPDEETARALAFLAYDFLGKIVEKAIFLRRLLEREESRANPSLCLAETDEDILEMLPGEQLSPEDIKRAMEDSTVLSAPLYNTATEDDGECKPQLYFGPGFEERLEMEMDEIVLGKKHSLTEEEKAIRKSEEELFAKMKKPPVKLDCLTDVLGKESLKGKDKKGNKGAKKQLQPQTEKPSDTEESDATGGQQAQNKEPPETKGKNDKKDELQPKRRKISDRKGKVDTRGRPQRQSKKTSATKVDTPKKRGRKRKSDISPSS